MDLFGPLMTVGKWHIGLLGIHGTTEKFVTSQALLTASQR